MKTVILVALLVVFVAVVMADEEKRFFFKKCKSNRDCAWRKMCCTESGKCGKCMSQRCRSDSECDEGRCCRRRKCRQCRPKRCKVDSDCSEGQCCLRMWKYGKCQAYQQEGDKCYVKKSFFMKRSCGCAGGLECQAKNKHYRRGKCVVVEGSGEM